MTGHGNSFLISSFNWKHATECNFEEKNAHPPAQCLQSPRKLLELLRGKHSPGNLAVSFLDGERQKCRQDWMRNGYDG